MIILPILEIFFGLSYLTKIFLLIFVFTLIFYLFRRFF